MTEYGNDQTSVEAAFLLERFKNGFTKITIRKWGYFFPCLIATWEFIAHFRPYVFGDVTIGYDNEPYFVGKGADWFVEGLLKAQDYQDLVEPIWYRVAHSITPEIRQREYLYIHEFPVLDKTQIEELAALILKKVDEGIHQGTII